MFTVFEDFSVFSNNIPSILATFDQKHNKHTVNPQGVPKSVPGIINLHTMCTVCICYVFTVSEDFSVFSNNILSISATFDQKCTVNTQ